MPHGWDFCEDSTFNAHRTRPFEYSVDRVISYDHILIFFGDHDCRAIPSFTGFSRYEYTMTLKGAAAHGN